MDTKAFREFIDAQDQFFRDMNTEVTDKEHVLYRTIKIGEEYGELCDAILSTDGNQRRNKLSEFKGGDLEAEFADVIITTFLLAKAMNVDVYHALEKKIEKIKTKHNKQLDKK